MSELSSRRRSRALSHTVPRGTAHGSGVVVRVKVRQANKIQLFSCWLCDRTVGSRVLLINKQLVQICVVNEAHEHFESKGLSRVRSLLVEGDQSSIPVEAGGEVLEIIYRNSPLSRVGWA